MQPEEKIDLLSYCEEEVVEGVLVVANTRHLKCKLDPRAVRDHQVLFHAQYTPVIEAIERMAKKGFSVEEFMAKVDKFDEDINGKPTGLVDENGDVIRSGGTAQADNVPLIKKAIALADYQEYKRQEENDTPFNHACLGTFAIPQDMLEDMKEKDSREVFKHFRIIKADYVEETDSIHYLAASFLFESSDDETIPGYQLQVGYDEERNIQVKAVRI